jgi:hypothetical protein
MRANRWLCCALVPSAALHRDSRAGCRRRTKRNRALGHPGNRMEEFGEIADALWRVSTRRNETRPTPLTRFAEVARLLQ